ncbi:MAG: hypothetical protein M3P41_05170 [Actinomycetota bacterium]|nr:hypothetical protein [Actinomycetota bacterium]
MGDVAEALAFGERAARCTPCCGGSENSHACIKQCQIAQAAPKLVQLLGRLKLQRREREIDN